jgi:hypothetical protein
MPHDGQDLGIVFPRAADGERSSSATGREIVAAALHDAQPAAAAAVRAERNWRSNYPRHLRQLVESALADDERPLVIARAGLAAAAAVMRFARDGAESSLAEAMASPRSCALRTATVSGRGGAPEPLAVPYGGRLLAGDALLRQVDDWCARGLAEPSLAAAIRRVHDHPDWLDLSDQHLVLLGAGAELGPFAWLARRRARLVAVDIARPAIWQRLIATARAGNGTLHLPLHAGVEASAGDDVLAQHAGADLLTETPEIADWLQQFSAPMTVGAYAYLDGAQHLRVAIAMDAIQAQCCAARRDTTLAMLATPTDLCAVPTEVMQGAHARHAQRPATARLWQQPLHWLSGGRLFARNVDPTTAGFGIVDALVVQQGPNYALAKRLQQWRALAARADGCRVSLHVAPPSLTGSVLKNRLMAAAYRAAGLFGVEAFAPETASALMAALLVHDLRHAEAVARPATPLAHPLLLLTDAAHHGGLWRMQYAARSALPAAALLGALRRR